MKSKLNLLTLLTCLLGVFSCSNSSSKPEIRLTDKVIVSNYIGNGAQWDPYDEAIAWGCELTDKHWDKLLTRVEFMKMGFVRCLINSPYTYYDAETNSYDKNRNNQSILRLLQFCTDNNITVLFGEYNPPKWEMKQSQQWVEWAVDYLNYLVVEKGMSCIKYYNFFNEPDGAWASTDGDYEMWLDMFNRFHAKMQEYPELVGKVEMAGPDAVIGYKNPKSAFDAVGWVAETAKRVDDKIGLYDVHAYPGQHAVRSGKMREELKKYVAVTPTDKPIVLGEAGYKYYDKEDAHLAAEYQKRCVNHPFTKGSDCNMLVYDYFYGLDMPLLCMSAMNVGYSGMAVWMMDDAMHSNGDSGKIEDVKLWGFWNTLGEDVFNDASQEEIRPWFFSFSLMSRYFPGNCKIMEVVLPELEGVYASANIASDGSKTVSLVNFSDNDYTISLKDFDMSNAKEYDYIENKLKVDKNGLPLPTREGVELKKSETISLPKQSFKLITNNKY